MQRVDSTNRVAKQRGLEGAPHGWALAAQEQTAGRGRLGRVWTAPPGNLNVSVVLRNGLTRDGIPWVTLAAGVVLSEVIETFTGERFAVKWPNDLLDGYGRKLAGVLAEAEWSGGELDFIVVGLGVNLEHSPPGLRATSLSDHGHSVPLAPFADAVAAAIGVLDLASIPDRWRARNGTLGRRVEVGTVRGVAVDLDVDGALLVETEHGRERVLTGDLGFLDPAG